MIRGPKPERIPGDFSSVLCSSPRRLSRQCPEFRFLRIESERDSVAVSAAASGEATIDPDCIRLLIRKKLQDGRMPRGHRPERFGRPANWQKCDACEEFIVKTQLMM